MRFKSQGKGSGESWNVEMTSESSLIHGCNGGLFGTQCTHTNVNQYHNVINTKHQIANCIESESNPFAMDHHDGPNSNVQAFEVRFI